MTLPRPQHRGIREDRRSRGRLPRASIAVRRERRGRAPIPATWSLLAVLAAAVLTIGLSACGGNGEQGADSAVLARVNGAPVTQAQVDDARAEARLADDADDADQALDDAIGRELVRQEAERLGLVVDDAAVEERVAAVTERLGGDEALAQALEGAAMSAEQLRRGAAYGLLREKLRDERFGEVTASDTAARSFYRKYKDDLFTEPASAKLGSIFVRTEPLAAKLVADIRAGKAFDRLAGMYNRDPEAKANDGMLGWISESSLPEPLRRAVRHLKKGAVSDPVTGPGGWYVLKLFDRREAEVTKFAAVEEQLRAELDLRKQGRALDRWIEAQRERADIELSGP